MTGIADLLQSAQSAVRKMEVRRRRTKKPTSPDGGNHITVTTTPTAAMEMGRLMTLMLTDGGRGSSKTQQRTDGGW